MPQFSIHQCTQDLGDGHSDNRGGAKRRRTKQALTVVEVLGDVLDLDGGDVVHEVVGGDDGERVPDGELDGPRGGVEAEAEELPPRADVP